jgi:DNA-binding NarL/FixJ family response regulator
MTNELAEGGPAAFLLVEDYAPVARAYQRSLERYGSVTVVGTVLDAQSFLASSTVTGLVTDISLPDGSGLDVAREARARMASLPILIISGGVDPSGLDAADELRAAYLLKPIEDRQLARFAERATARQRRVTALLLDWTERYSLSAAEAVTFRLCVEGLRRREIAVRRRVSPNTVKMQIGSLLNKVGAQNISEVVTAFFSELSRL